MTEINTTVAKLHPVYDIGGNKQGCYSASAQVVSAIDSLVGKLNATTLPAGYERAHQHLLVGLDTERRGLALRNTALTTAGKDSDWTQGNSLMATGSTQINDALQEYPKDSGILS